MKESLVIRLMIGLACVIGAFAGYSIAGGIRLHDPDSIFWGVGYLMIAGILINGAFWIKKIERETPNVHNASLPAKGQANAGGGEQ